MGTLNGATPEPGSVERAAYLSPIRQGVPPALSATPYSSGTLAPLTGLQGLSPTWGDRPCLPPHTVLAEAITLFCPGVDPGRNYLVQGRASACSWLSLGGVWGYSQPRAISSASCALPRGISAA